MGKQHFICRLFIIASLVISCQTVFVDQQRITQLVNYYREAHASLPVRFDSRLSNLMQIWTDRLAATGGFHHSKYPFGENLAMIPFVRGCHTLQNATTYVEYAVAAWYNEELVYNYTTPTYSEKTGHFTQLVWKRTSNIGLGVSVNLTTCRMIVGMAFDPPGNYKSLMAQNVFPRVTRSSLS